MMGNPQDENESRIDALLSQATCKVIAQGQPKGTAWLVSPEGELLTARHVITSGGRTVTNLKVCFHGEKQEELHVQVAFIPDNEDLDFAVLRLLDKSSNIKPLPVRLPDSVSGTFKALGVAKETGMNFAFASGTFSSKYLMDNDPAKEFFQVTSNTLKASGFSGSAVFSHELDAVVAIAAKAFTSKEAFCDVCLPLPLHRVAQAWPKLYTLAASEFAAHHSWLLERNTLDKLERYYVGLDCRGKKSKNREPQRLDKSIDRWLKSPDKTMMFLLGPYGAGKSWFCRQYAQTLLKKREDDPNVRTPILAYLDQCDSGGICLNPLPEEHGTQRVQGDLNREGQPVRLSWDELKSRQNKGHFLLLLDGLDNFSQGETDSPLDFLKQLATSPGKTIVTLRESLFETEEDARAAIERLFRDECEIVSLCGFKGDQIRTVLKNRFGAQSDKLADMIEKNHDLLALAERPVLLGLMAPVLPSLDPRFALTPADVYAAVLEDAAAKDVKRTEVDKATQKRFLVDVAWKMFTTEKWRLTKRVIDEIVIFPGNRLVESSLLQPPNAQGEYEFIHGSVTEYLVATRLRDALRCNRQDDFKVCPIYFEILSFVDQLLPPPDARREDAWRKDAGDRLLAWLDAQEGNTLASNPKAEATWRENCIRLLGQWREPVVLNRLMAIAKNTGELAAHRRDAIRSMCRVLWGEDARTTGEGIEARVIRTHRIRLRIHCADIVVRLFGDEAHKVALEVSQHFHGCLTDALRTFFECLNDQSSEIEARKAVRVNASFALIHVVSRANCAELLEALEREADPVVKFNLWQAIRAVAIDETRKLKKRLEGP